MSMQVSRVWWDGEKLMAEPISAAEVYKPEPVTEWLTCPKCGHKSPYSPIKAKTLAEDAERITKQARAALAERAAQQEPVAWCPDVCPITGLPFFMWIEHHETGQRVPTYGGPYDSYTIPVRDKDGSYCRERYDHDRGGWLTDEVEDVGVQIVSDQAFVYDDEPPQAREPLNLAIIRKWPDGFQDRLQHVWLDVVSFIPDVKLYDLQRVLAEYGFEMQVYEAAHGIKGGQHG